MLIISAYTPGGRPVSPNSDRQVQNQGATDWQSSEQTLETAFRVERAAEHRQLSKKLWLSWGIISPIVLTFSLLKNHQFAQQPFALVLRADYLEVMGEDGQENQRFFWQEIDSILYIPGRHRTEESFPTYRHEQLYIKNKAGQTLVTIALEGLAGVDLSTIQRDISSLAPHIRWIFP